MQMIKNTNKIIIKDIESKTKLFKSLGDDTRLKILEVLLNNDKENHICICEISAKLKKDQSTIFRHIHMLKESGIVKTQKEDKRLVCSLVSEERLVEFLKFVTECQKYCK